MPSVGCADDDGQREGARRRREVHARGARARRAVAALGAERDAVRGDAALHRRRDALAVDLSLHGRRRSEKSSAQRTTSPRVACVIGGRFVGVT